MGDLWVNMAVAQQARTVYSNPPTQHSSRVNRGLYPGVWVAIGRAYAVRWAALCVAAALPYTQHGQAYTIAYDLWVAVLCGCVLPSTQHSVGHTDRCI